MKNKLPLKVLAKCRKLGKEYGLEAHASYYSAPVKKLQKKCNGVGPEWFPEMALEIGTGMFEYFLPSTNIHDWEADQLPCTEDGFKLWNDRLRSNMTKQYVTDYKKDIAELSWGWFNPLRWEAKAERNFKATQADLLVYLCRRFGKKAFMEAQSNNK